jgi:hypothetical protein
VKKDVSKFIPFGFWAYINTKTEGSKVGMLHKQWKLSTLGFLTECNTSRYKFLIEYTGTIIILNKSRFDDDFYQYRNSNMIELHLDDITKLDILTIDTEDY